MQKSVFPARFQAHFTSFCLYFVPSTRLLHFLPKHFLQPGDTLILYDKKSSHCRRPSTFFSFKRHLAGLRAGPGLDLKPV